MFDVNLYLNDKVLSSVGIQERYQEAVKSRGLKKAVVVDADFWLLDTEQTKSYIAIRNNSDYSKNNDSLYIEKNHKQKENKKKTNNINTGKCTADIMLCHNCKLTEEQIIALKKYIVDLKTINGYISTLSTYITLKGYSNIDSYKEILCWALRDKKLTESFYQDVGFCKEPMCVQNAQPYEVLGILIPRFNESWIRCSDCQRDCERSKSNNIACTAHNIYDSNDWQWEKYLELKNK